MYAFSMFIGYSKWLFSTHSDGEPFCLAFKLYQIGAAHAICFSWYLVFMRTFVGNICAKFEDASDEDWTLGIRLAKIPLM